MQWLLVTFCVGLILIGCGNADKIDDKELYPQKDGYLQLDEHNFVAALRRFHFVFTFYYGKDKESKQVEDDVMAKIFENVKSSGSVVHLAKIDAIKEHEIIRKFPIFGTPQFRLFKNAKTFDYVGEMKVDKLMIWLDLAMNVPLQINTGHELESLKKTTSVVLGCFPGKAPEAAFKTFYKVSEYFVYPPHMPVPRFAIITTASLARDLGVVTGSVSVYKAFEGGAKASFASDVTDFEKVLKFVEEETIPVVFKNHQLEYSRRLTELTVKHQHLLFMSSDDKNYNEAFNNFKAAAKKFQNQTAGREVTFVHYDLKLKEQTTAISYYHIDVDKDVPCNRMTKIDHFHSRFVPSRKDFSVQGFVDFTESVLDGKLKRNIKSDPLPSDWDNYDVKTIVGSNYEKFINDKSKTVFMLYYVPKDPQSEAALPIFNELAKDFRSNNSIKIGKMNIATNDGEVNVHIKVPTIKMFTTDGKSKTYEMSVTKEAMKTFIMVAGTNQIAKSKQDDDDQGMEYDFKFIDEDHPVDTVVDEEKRRKEWEEEEKKLLETAVEHIVGHEAHDDEAYKDRHPLQHLSLEERDPKHMDPKKHADFEHMHEHEDHYEHTEEL